MLGAAYQLNNYSLYSGCVYVVISNIYVQDVFVCVSWGERERERARVS